MSVSTMWMREGKAATTLRRKAAPISRVAARWNSTYANFETIDASSGPPTSVARRLAAPLGVVREEIHSPVFPVGRHDALDPVILNLRGDENGVAG